MLKAKNIFLICLAVAAFSLSAVSFVLAISTSTGGTTTVSGSYTKTPDECINCGGDGTAPAAVSNLTASNVTASALTLTWTAPGDDGSSGTANRYALRYSTSTITESNWGQAQIWSNVPLPAAAGASQTATVSGLSSQTTYYFALKTADEVPNWSSLSNIVSAITLVGLDVTPPNISNLQVSNISASSAIISFATNEAATSTLLYGKTTSYELGLDTKTQLSTSHSFTLTNLDSQTTYHFKVKAADAAGNEASSSDQAFTTLDNTPPVISQIQTAPDITFAVISWQTNEPADSQIAYGLTNQLGVIISDVNLKTNHSLTVTGLQPKTKYFYVVRSTDESGNQGSGDLSSLITLKDANSPANVSGLQAQAGDKVVSLTWANPPDSDFAGVLIRRSTTDYPQNPAEGTKVFQGAGQSFQDTGLTNNILYYYTVFAYDTSDNYASGALAKAAPQGLSLPQCSDALDNDGDGKIDYPADPGCESQEDNDEIDEIIPQQPQCNDGIDNDGDGKIDYPADPGCASSADNDETDPEIQPPIVIPSGGGTAGIDFRQEISDFIFTVAKGKIIIPPKEKMSTLVGTGFSVALSQAKAKKSVLSVVLNLTGGSYLFAFQENKKQWQTEITVPFHPGIYQVDALISFFDQTNTVVSWQLETLPYGRVYEKAGGVQKSLARAKVTLTMSPTLWPAVEFFQLNPQLTGSDGSFGFLAPAGRYHLAIEKENYRTEKLDLTVENLVINSTVELLFVPPLLKDVIKPEAPFLENVGEVAKNVGAKTVFASKIITREAAKIIAKPEVKEAAKEVAAPVVAGAAAASATAAIGFAPLLNYLRFLFTQPILLFRRRKRLGWGVVYNSLTKMPVDLVTVRLVEAEQGRIVQTRVTDKAGRYSFFSWPGFYRIEIDQEQFKFPTEFLAAFKEDGRYLDIYHGEIIEVKEKGATITANIPLDPLGAVRPIGQLVWQLAWRRFQHTLSIVSLILALVFVFWVPGWLTGGLLTIQIIFYFLFRRLALPPKSKSWGIIYDEKTRQPLIQAVARIFDRQYNKLLETQVADKRGRYSFLVGRNEYYLTFEKNGYEKKQSAPIDLRSHPEPAASVGIDVGLKPLSSEQEVSTAWPSAPELPKPPESVEPPAPPPSLP